MCDPVTLATAAIATAAVGVGVQTYGAYTQQKAANAAAEYNAKILESNAKVSEYNAENARQRGELEEKQFRLRLSQEKGSARAAFGASGALVNDGSSQDYLSDLAEFGEMDALTIRHNAATEAYGYKVQSQNYVSQGNLSRMSKASTGLAAGTTLLTGTSSLLSQTAKFKQGGLL